MTAFLIRSKKFDALVKQLNDFEKSKNVGKVGWVKASRYPSGVLIPAVARVQEHGNPANNIPSRSMLSATAQKKGAVWTELAGQLAKTAVETDASVDTVLESLVQRAAGDVRTTISELQEPPLKPATIKARLRKRKDRKTIGKLDKPLVDTGVLLNTVTGVVEHENSRK